MVTQSGESNSRFVALVQPEDFDVSEQIRALRQQSSQIGAVATFQGLVSDFNADHLGGDADAVPSKTLGLELEHYPGMTEKSLANIIQQASQRWPLIAARVLHRVGRLNISDQIVFVGVASRHRHTAFDACAFIMDYLKTEAPFWKKEITESETYWVDARESDSDAKDMWGSIGCKRKD